jgi:hypothetical protein
MLQYCVRRAHQTPLVRDGTAVLWDARVALGAVNDVMFSLRTTIRSCLSREWCEEWIAIAFRVDHSLGIHEP